MITAALYCRATTNKDTLEDQLAELRGFAARNEWPLLEYMEGDLARQDAPRPVLAQLLEDAAAGKFQVVICRKMDRFSRSSKDFIANVEFLDGAGVRFICTAQPVDTDPLSPSGQILMEMLRTFAQFERDLFTERARLGVARSLRYEKQAARSGRRLRTKSGKGLPHGAPRKIWHRGRVTELHNQGMSVRAIAAEVGSTYGSVRRVLEANSDADACIAAGTAKQAAGNLAGAVQDFTTAIRLKPDDPKAYRSRSLALRANKKPEAAKRDWDKALELEAPTD